MRHHTLTRNALSLLVVVLMIGCARQSPISTRSGEPGQAAVVPAETPADRPAALSAAHSGPQSVEEWLQYLTLEEKIGQMLWVGFEGPAPDTRTEGLLAAGKAGGVILFGRNGSEPGAVRGLIARLQEVNAARGRFSPALVVMADQEGGLVQRYLHPFTEWPGNMALGATRNPEYARAMAAAAGKELLAIGVNMNLAPVADVNNNPGNPVIGIRSFGEESELVARMTAAAVRGYRQAGVLATAKHFPGHGDTAVDSHYALPVIPHSLERLETVELPPFRAAIAAGADAVMTAHILFPALVPDGRAATLSSEILTGLLRQRLGFAGVIVTDAMEMKAIAADPGVEQGLLLAVQAGADALLLAESFADQERFHGLLLQAVLDGRIPAARIDESVRRLLTMKEAVGLLRSPGPMRPAADVIGSAEHRLLAEQIAAGAVTLVRNDEGLLPLRLQAEEQILVVMPNLTAARAPASGGAVTWLGQAVSEQHGRTVELVVNRGTPDEQQRVAIRERLAESALVIYAVYNAGAAHAAIVREVIAAGKRLVLVGLGEPYDLLQIPEAGTYVAAYGFLRPNLLALGPPLFGRRPFAGKLPVQIPGLYSVGHGMEGRP